MKIRTRVFMLAALVVGVFTPGCGLFEPKVVSPVTGNEVTYPQLIAEANKARDEQERKAAKEIADKEAELRRVAAEAKVRAMQIKQDAQNSASVAETQLAVLEVETGARLEQATAEVRQIRDSIDSYVAALESNVNDAITEINRKKEQGAGILKFIGDNPVVRGAGASVGLDTGEIAGGLGGLLGLGGLAAAWRSGKKRETEWDESAEKTKTLILDTQQRAQMDMLRLMFPAMAAQAAAAAPAAIPGTGIPRPLVQS